MNGYEFWAIVVICIAVLAVVNEICECLENRARYKYNYHDKTYRCSTKESDKNDN